MQNHIPTTDSVNFSRGTPAQEKPFCWQSRKALKMIRANIDNHAPTALAVYLALTEIASERSAPEFQTTHAEIMQRSGVRSDRTVRDRLGDLRELGLIDVQENWISSRMRGPSSYRILALGNDYRALGNGEGSEITESSIKTKKSEEKKETRTSVRSLSDFENLGYDQDCSAKLSIYDRVCVQSGIGFLPVDIFNEALAERLAWFDDIEELERLFAWTVELVRRGKWSRTSKTLRGIIEDEAFNDPPPDENDTF